MTLILETVFPLAQKGGSLRKQNIPFLDLDIFRIVY